MCFARRIFVKVPTWIELPSPIPLWPFTENSISGQIEPAQRHVQNEQHQRRREEPGPEPPAHRDAFFGFDLQHFFDGWLKFSTSRGSEFLQESFVHRQVAVFRFVADGHGARIIIYHFVRSIVST